MPYNVFMIKTLWAALNIGQQSKSEKKVLCCINVHTFYFACGHFVLVCPGCLQMLHFLLLLPASSLGKLPCGAALFLVFTNFGEVCFALALAPAKQTGE